MTMIPSQILADNVRRQRGWHRWTQDELVAQVHDVPHVGHIRWTRTTVAKIELGTRGVTTDELVALAKALNVDIMNLLSAA